MTTNPQTHRVLCFLQCQVGKKNWKLDFGAQAFHEHERAFMGAQRKGIG